MSTQISLYFYHSSHYENLPMQYTEIFSEEKLKILLEKKRMFLIFLLKTYIVGTRQNRLAGAVQTSARNVCFGSEIR